MMKGKMKAGFAICDYNGEKVLQEINATSKSSKRLILNESAELLIDLLINQECDIPDDLIDLLLDNYMVDYVQAKNDVDTILDVLKRLDILELSDN